MDPAITHANSIRNACLNKNQAKLILEYTIRILEKIINDADPDKKRTAEWEIKFQKRILSKINN